MSWSTVNVVSTIGFLSAPAALPPSVDTGFVLVQPVSNNTARNVATIAVKAGRAARSNICAAGTAEASALGACV
ncbi:MAG: hypothetical protein E7A81_08010 [Clostridiales bacterium]|nr:hypothetical protein [Clostridiales bacterium]